MNDLLVLLFKHGASRRPCSISTVEIGNLLGMSQQNASRCLIALEQNGKIQRTKKGMLLTAHGTQEILKLYRDLKAGFSKKHTTRFKGKIVAGLQEGAYYLSLPGYKKPLRDTLGFNPYPGTLNLKLNGHTGQVLPLPDQGIFIPGFEWKKRSFGGLYIYPCKIEGISGALVRPVRTHHGRDILELIASVSLKKKLKRKEGDWVEVIL